MTDPRSLPDWPRAVAALKEADSVAIATHVNPDGDAMGSLLGASLALRALGKSTTASWGDERATIPVAYEFLPGVETLVQPEEVPECDVFLALDCGAGDRLGRLEALVKAAACSINLDHHPGNDDFATINVVAESASSTAELLTHLLRDVGAPIDLDVATCLYTGIVTDTGRFQYANTSPEVLRLAAELLEIGVPSSRIAQEVFESAPFGYLKLMGIVLDRARLDEGRSFVYSWLTLADLETTAVASDETDKLIDQIRSTRAADVAAMFKERRDGTYRVSLRSKGPRSVGLIARENGGGGHELAAGFTAADITSGVAAVVAGLDRQVG